MRSTFCVSSLATTIASPSNTHPPPQQPVAAAAAATRLDTPTPHPQQHNCPSLSPSPSDAPQDAPPTHTLPPSSLQQQQQQQPLIHHTHHLQTTSPPRRPSPHTQPGWLQSGGQRSRAPAPATRPCSTTHPLSHLRALHFVVGHRQPAAAPAREAGRRISPQGLLRE
jgi:hypothetical protein